MLIPIYFRPAEKRLRLLKGKMPVWKAEGAATDQKKGLKCRHSVLASGFFVETTCQRTHTLRNRCSVSTRVCLHRWFHRRLSTYRSRCLDFFVHHSEIAYLGCCFDVRSRAGFSQPLCCFFLFGALIFKSMEPRNGKVITGASRSLQIRARVLFLHREVDSVLKNFNKCS